MTNKLTLLLLIIPGLCAADSGVIIPTGSQTPDPSILEIDSMDLHVTIDDGHALVRLREVFHNKTNRVLEGTFSMGLPGGASVSDFAVWDDLTRIPGVILERKRASELYDEIRAMSIDPGLLESGEVSESDAPGQAHHSRDFGVKIVPIPAFGYKRVEIEYRQNIPVSLLSSGFAIPFKPVTYDAQRVRHFSASFELRSSHALADFAFSNGSLPITVTSRTEHLVKGQADVENQLLDRDFSLSFKLTGGDGPSVQAYRSAENKELGFFEVSAPLQAPARGPASQSPTTIVLLDTSLSMQREKLERSFQALEGTLRSLAPGTAFNVVVFNSEVRKASPSPVPASAESVASALEFVRASRLRGGTDLRAALSAALGQATNSTDIVLLSDGELTEGDLSPARFESWVDGALQALPAQTRPRFYVLAIGDDANRGLLQRLAARGGVFEEVGSAESLEFKLKAFIQKIGLRPLDRVTLNVSPSVQPSLVYRLEGDDFPGGVAEWTGRYGTPAKAEFTIDAGKQSKIQGQLPVADTSHPYLPALWARARVDALLAKIDLEGEDKASIDEIIRLSRQYKFVTPYTSFLAAPRALLRPRLIRPGDPVLRVRTDPAIVSLIALFPFGPIQPLRFIKDENIWQTRFLVPDDVADGSYAVRLILRDRSGHTFREQKVFVVSSQAPSVRVHLASTRVRAGSSVALDVQASKTTRTITARLYGVPPLSLRWDANRKSNAGVLFIPATLPPGRYSLAVTAEDVAHNVSRQEVPLEVLP